MIVFVLAFSEGCVQKTVFNEEELRWLNVYNAGDTLIFQSSNHDLDTSIIVKKSIYYPEYMPIEVHGRYLPQHGEVWYKNKNFKYHPDGGQLISMIKREPKKATVIDIDYLYNGVIVPDLSTGFKKYRQGKVYALDCFNERAKNDVPKMIYWQEDSGVVKYITHSNVEWNLIALIRAHIILKDSSHINNGN